MAQSPVTLSKRWNAFSADPAIFVHLLQILNYYDQASVARRARVWISGAKISIGTIYVIVIVWCCEAASVNGRFSRSEKQTRTSFSGKIFMHHISYNHSKHRPAGIYHNGVATFCWYPIVQGQSFILSSSRARHLSWRKDRPCRLRAPRGWRRGGHEAVKRDNNEHSAYDRVGMRRGGRGWSGQLCGISSLVGLTEVDFGTCSSQLLTTSIALQP